MTGAWNRRLPFLLALAALMVGTLDEGGARPTGMLVTHLLLVLAVVALALRTEPGSNALAVAPHTAFVAFVCCAAAGALTAPYAFAALLVCIEIAMFYAALRLGAAAGPSWIDRLSWPVLALGSAQGLLAIYQFWVEDVRRPAGTFLNPNHLAAWLVAALVLGIGARWSRAGRHERIARVTLAVPALVGLRLCGSRGALLGVSLAALWWTWVSWRSLAPRGRRALGLVWLVLLVGGGWMVRDRLAGADPYRYHRLRIWRASFQAALDHPWTGVGPGQWSAAAPRYNFANNEGPLRYERRLDSTHSDLIRLPVEFGWPATLAALAVLLLAAREIRRVWSGGRPPPETIAALTLLVAWAGQACVDNLSQRPALYLLAGSLLGALLARPVERPGPRSLLLRGFLALGILWAFVLADVTPYWAWRLARGEDPALGLSLSANPLHYDNWMRRAEARGSGMTSFDPAGYAAIREDAETAVRLNPADAGTRLRLARLERRAFVDRFGDLASRQRVADEYREAERLAPTDPFIALEGAEFLLAAGDPAGARRGAERVLAIEPNAVPGHLLLARALLDADGVGAAERAAVQLTRALEIEGRTGEIPIDTPYGRRLLRADPRRVADLERRLAVGSSESEPR